MEFKVANNKYPKSKQKDLEYLAEHSAYVSWDSDDTKDRDVALAKYSQSLGTFTSANNGRNFKDLTTHQGSRPGLRNSDYDYFRPNERVPSKPKEIIAFARKSYRQIGLIRNAIDLIGDFACQGIRLVHPNKRIERFYNDWFTRVAGKAVSERFCNLLFREANVPIRMKTAKINKSKRLEMQKTVAEIDMKATLKNDSFKKGELPWQYVFLDPLLLDVVGGPLASLSGKFNYRMDIPSNLKRELAKIRQTGAGVERDLIDSIPDELLDPSNNKGILLPPDKTFVYHYKKDDWQVWADPMTYACFDDLILYQKLKLADKAALDGAVNKIRVWKLGSLDHKLAPTAAAASALGDILGANTGCGTMDIVWGPDIELIETGTDVQRFLGDEKYRPTLMSIYSCLGIPPTLTGTFGASGTTNNFISLKTLTERLNYVRSVLLSFWNEQIQIVQKSMGFRFGAQVEFDFMHLEDPSTMAQLLINLADRNIVSDEFVQRNIKAKPEIEQKRILNETKQRDRGAMQEKVSPYHAVDKEYGLEKIALQTGVATPSEVGLDLNERKDGESPALEIRTKKREEKKDDGPKQQELPFPEENDNTGVPGRPKNSNDTEQRKPRGFKPALKASIELWAKKTQDKISKTVNPALLAQFDKKNMRSLSSEEFEQAEKIKFEILCNLDYKSDLTDELIFASIKKPEHGMCIHNECDQWITEASEDFGRRLSIEEIRSIRASYYCYLKIEKNH